VGSIYGNGDFCVYIPRYRRPCAAANEKALNRIKGG